VLRRSVSALRPPSTLSQTIAEKLSNVSVVSKRSGSAQRPPSDLSKQIEAKVERRERGVEAQCSASARPPPSPKPQLLRRSTVTLNHAFKPSELKSAPRLYNRVCLSTAVRIGPARGQHLVMDSGGAVQGS
jgi:hypothetical protein